MGLFILGSLSRYRPEIWNPFIKNDSTGEKQLLEKFINICKRYLPNLALNALYEIHIRFLTRSYSILDLSKEINENELEEKIKQEIAKFLQNRRNRV